MTDRVCTHAVPKMDDLENAPGIDYSLDEQCVFKYGEGFTYHVSNNSILPLQIAS